MTFISFLLLILFWSIVVDAIVDVLLSPASLFYQKVWSRIIFFFTEGSFFNKLFSCPYCLSFWFSQFFAFTFTPNFIGAIFVGLVIWRVANFWRLFYINLLHKSISSQADFEIEIEE